MSTAHAAASLRHLMRHLQAVEQRVRRLVAVRRRGDPEPDDPVRGLYISEEQVDRLLAGGTGQTPPPSIADGPATEVDPDWRLPRLAGTFGLDATDVDLLLIALAPDLDARFERLYGYLNDDVTRRRATVGLAFELLGLDLAGAAARRRLAPEGPLVGPGLVHVHDRDRPVLTRALRAPDRVTTHLLGDDTPTSTVASLAVSIPSIPVPEAAAIARALAADIDVVHVREGARTAGMAAGVSGLAAAGRTALCVDLARLPDDRHDETAIAQVLREAALIGAGVVAGPIDGLMARNRAALGPVRHARVPVVVVGRDAWDPGWLDTVPAMIEAGPISGDRRDRLWSEVAGPGVDFDVVSATRQFRLKPEQAVRAWRSARHQAAAAGRDVRPGDLHVGARLQNAGRLEHLARRITPRADMGDLVLPRRVLDQLLEIVHRARHRETVLDAWRVGGASDKGRGTTALFAGESGTGKTLSAEVVANELALDLYVIDLSTVVDKYIGETEKNLERIFEQAEDVNGVLFFDEADALFGKRSEVSDARDRYANVEIAYLLQRMERFDGITILATNLRANLDEAFTRRIDVLVDFPEPEEEDRRRLWELHLPTTLPQDTNLDLDFLAQAFELAGGDIRNVTLAAAYAAAVNGGRVGTEDLVRATAREYRKLGRLVTDSEFGPWLDRVAAAETREGPRE